MRAVRFVEPVLAEVRSQLLASPFAAIRQLQSEFYEGVIILRGQVPTFHNRQVALALVRKVAGVEQVDDQIVVCGLVAR